MDIKEVLNLPNGTKVKRKTKSLKIYSVYTVESQTLKYKNGTPVNLSLCNVEAEYELVRKKLNFFEAMALVNEGKTVENSAGYIYKRYSDGLLVSKYKKYIEDEFVTKKILAYEILSDWYEVIE